MCLEKICEKVNRPLKCHSYFLGGHILASGKVPNIAKALHEVQAIFERIS